MTFPDAESHLRTEVEFEAHADPNHHIALSPLQGLEIGLISSFVLHYMHLVCLGVMKRLLDLWMPLRGSGKLPFSIAESISRTS